MTTISELGRRAARLAERVIPDPLVLAIGLFVIAFALAGITQGPGPALHALRTGMLSSPLLAFAFQMALILASGHALAEAPVVRRALAGLAGAPRTTSGAAALVAVVAMVLGLLNWGLGLVGGALFARATGDAFRARGAPLNYGLVGAAGYMGLLVWHGGLSGSAPLKVASDGAFGPALPVSTTIFAPMNLTLTFALLLVVPGLFALLGRGAHDDDVAPPARAPVPVTVADTGASGALVVVVALALPVVFALGHALVVDGQAAITLDFVILLFVAAGLVAHGKAGAYQRAFGDGAAGAAGILLQFPIYFGVLACAQASGVLASMARAFVDVARELPVADDVSSSIVTFLSAALINVFVPSGGGQWVLQSPILVETAATMDVTREKLVMAFAYGDELTNMLQPFWALPLLSITGLRAGQVMGYTMVAMVAAVPFIVGVLAIF